MFKTLYARLSLVLILLFLVTGALYALITTYQTERYLQEITQHFNRQLAQRIVADRQLISGGKLDQKRDDALKVLEVVSQCQDSDQLAAQAKFEFQHTVQWQTALEAVVNDERRKSTLLDELRLDAARYRAVHQQALENLLASGSEDPADDFPGNAAAGVANLDADFAAAGECSEGDFLLGFQHLTAGPALLDGIARVDQKVDHHLLELSRVGQNLRQVLLSLPFHGDAA